MSHTEPDPDLVPIGQTPEWMAWFERALAEIARERSIEWEQQTLNRWRPIGIINHLPDIAVRDEPQLRADTLALVRAHGRTSVINHFPYDFRP